MNKVLCPQYESVSLFGSWSEPAMNRLKVQVRMCDWEKKKDFCKSEAEIKEYFHKNGPNLNILYLDFQINVKNYSSLIEYFPVYIYKYFVPEFLKITYFQIQEQTLFTDSDLILSNIQEETFLKLNEQPTEITDIDKDNKIMNIFLISASNLYDSYHRNYIKVPQIIAVIGGLMKSITFFMEILVEFFSSFVFYNTLINKIFKIEGTDSIKKNRINRCLEIFRKKELGWEKKK